MPNNRILATARFDLTDFEWSVSPQPFLPNKPRGVPRVDDLMWHLTAIHTRPGRWVWHHKSSAVFAHGGTAHFSLMWSV